MNKEKKQRERRGMSMSAERREWGAFVGDQNSYGNAMEADEMESIYVSERVAPTGKAGHPVKPERVMQAMV